MPPNGEINNPADVVMQAQQEVRDRVRAIEAEEAGIQALQKQQFARELTDELEQRTTAAEQVAMLGVEGNQLEAQQVKTTVAKVLEAVNQGIIEPADPKAKKLLIEILRKGITSDSAAHLHGLVEKYLTAEISFSSTGESPTSFEQDLAILQQTQPVIYSIVIQVLNATPESYDLTPDQAQRLIPTVESPVGTFESGQSRPTATPDEKAEFATLRQKIHQSVQTNQFTKLTRDEINDINKATVGFAHIGAVADSLQKIGISPDEIRRFDELYSKIMTPFNTESIGRTTGIEYLDRELVNATVAFNEDNINPYITKNSAGDWEITVENRKAIKKLMTRYYYVVFQDIDRNPSLMFQDLFSPYTHGYYINGLQGVISQLMGSREIRDKLYGNNNDSYEFIQNLNNYAATLYNNARLFHDLPIYALNAETHEQWKGFIAQLFPSEIAEIYDDPLMKFARGEITRYIKMRITLNGNQLPEDLFDARYENGKVMYSFKDNEALRKILTDRARELGLVINQDTEWEINRAISYGRGLGLLTLQDLQTMGNADANPSFRSIPDLIKLLKQRMKWRQGHGGFGITYIPELFTMDIVHNPEKRNFLSRLLFRRKWIPKKVKELAENEVRVLGEELDYKLMDREGAWNELMNIFDLGDQFSRASWRMEHLMPGGGDVNSETGIRLQQALRAKCEFLEWDKSEFLEWDNYEDWNSKQWEVFFDVTTQELGSGALWFYMEKRVNAEVRRLFFDYMKVPNKPPLVEGEPNYDEKLAEKYETAVKKAKELLPEYLTGSKSFDKIIKIDGKDYTLYEVRQMKEYQIKGDIFYYQMKRSPADFLLNLQLLVPELLDDFDPATGERKTSGLWNGKSYEKLTLPEKMIFDKWGKDGIAELTKVHDWINELVSAYDTDPPHPNVDFSVLREGEITDPRAMARLKREAILKYVYQQCGTAFERSNKRVETARQQAKQNNTNLNLEQSELFLKMEDVSDPILRRFLFDQQAAPNVSGFIPNLDRFSNHLFQNPEGINSANLFYITGKAWSIKNGADNPTTSDLDYFAVYQDIAKVGQGMVRRLHNDLDSWNKVAQEVGNLDRLLYDAANSGDMSKIFELHANVERTLEDIIGIDIAHKANYLIGSIVAQYFWEHSAARGFPGIIKTLPARLLLGKDVSLSKLHQGRTAMSWDDQKVREYFHNLSYEHNFINQKWRWSHDMAKLGFNAEFDTYVINSLATGTVLLFLYLMYSAMKKSLEEETGKKGGR